MKKINNPVVRFFSNEVNVIITNIVCFTLLWYLWFNVGLTWGQCIISCVLIGVIRTMGLIEGIKRGLLISVDEPNWMED
tara:strand:+ start:364 stop:600 length:237 start_codon:yes stop_codon:yes gene_type:complete